MALILNKQFFIENDAEKKRTNFKPFSKYMEMWALRKDSIFKV